MNDDERQDRRDRRKEKERTGMVVHKVKSPRIGERLVKIATRQALRRSAARVAKAR